LELIPWWLSLILLALTPQLFFLVYPMLTRSPRGRLAIPPLKRLLVELGIAAALVIGIVAAMGAISYALDRVSPGTSLTPDALRQLAESQRPWAIMAMMTFAFTVAPIAEEVFFRGFLQNAFSARMPVVVATLLQASIFGAIHFFGVAHSVSAAVMGVILAVVYRWRGTLVTPIFVHAGTNFFGALVIAAMAIAYANSPMLGVGGGPDDTECVVRMIVPNSAAEKAGLQVGDVIVRFNGQEIGEVRQLAEWVRSCNVGDTIPVSINRAGVMMELDVVLQRRDGS
jgi:membrane protease YdiL (CAAX protease family)